MRAITFLNGLVRAIPVLRVLDQVAVVGKFLDLAEMLEDNDVLLSELGVWLEQDGSSLPDELNGWRMSLLDLREAYRVTYGQES